MGLQKKWDTICQQHHFSQSLSKGYIHQPSHQFPRVLGFSEKSSNSGSKNSSESSNEQGNKNVCSGVSTDLWQNSSLNGLSSLDMLSKANNLSLLSKSGEIPSQSKGELGSLKSRHFDFLSAGINDGHTSPTSVTSVTTNLGLGFISASSSIEPEKSYDKSHLDFVDLSGSLSKNVDTSLFQQCPLFNLDKMHSDVKDPKSLYKALVEIVGQQEEAISAMVDAITQCRTKTNGLNGASQRNMWINLQGPDRFGKKRLGLALAEILYRSKESFIYVDLSFQDEMTHADTLFNSQVANKYELTMRGTVLDYLVDKLSKRPSIVFLENIDKADLLVQNSLSQAVKTGRFTDFCGRELNTRNCIFLGTTTRFLEDGQSMSNGKESAKYSEEDILSAKCSSIQILIRFDLNDDPISKGSSDLLLMNKRKLVSKNRSTDQCGKSEVTKRAHKASNSYLDLNLPADGSEIYNSCSGESDSDSSSGPSKSSWLEDFEAQIDQTVVFKPFDFYRLADKLFKDMSECLNNVVGSKCSMEIEPNVMQQVLAAAYLYGNKKVDDWIQHVVGKGIVEAMERYSIDARSVVKLITCEGNASEVEPEGLLPARIIL